MGVAVIGGLLMSTLLTLVVVPCLFSLMEDGRTRWLQRLHRRKPARRAGSEAAAPHAAEAAHGP